MTQEDSEVDNIFDLLKDERKSLIYSRKKQVLLILGNNDSDNNVIAKIIINNKSDLSSLKENNKHNFTIVNDKKETLKNVYTELYHDKTKKRIVYNFPLFSNKKINENILRAYILKNVINNADSIKIVFTITYSAATKAANREDFESLVKHAVPLFNNLKKFKNSIVLIVKKVDVPNAKNRTISDQAIITNIVKFLKNIQKKNSSLENGTEFEQKTKQFINILLEKGANNSYKRIGIFKRPQMRDLTKKNEKIDINQDLNIVVNQNSKYSKLSENDFNFFSALGSKTELYNKSVQRIIEKINNNIALDIQIICDEIKNNYLHQEKLIHDIESLRDKFLSGYNSMLKIKEDLSKISKSGELVVVLTQGINNSNITISNTNLESLENTIDILNFMEAISNSFREPRSYEWAKKLNEAIDDLGNSIKWYDFCIKLNNILSTYNIQKNINILNMSIREHLLHLENDKNNKQDIIKELIILLEHLVDCNFEIAYENIKTINLNAFKLRSLKEIFNSALLHKVQPLCAGEELTIRGSYVKLTDIDQSINETNCKTTKSIKIFALNKVFIDADFNKTGNQMQLSIIAPIWEIINERKIILDGTNASVVYHTRARDGFESNNLNERNGEDGKPGQDGGPSGRFIGIGKTFINDKNLKISVNGGKGGPGQDGGNGFKGKNGGLPQNDYHCPGVSRSLISKCYEYGKNCTDGGKGGNGGEGGKGGLVQKVELIALEDHPNISISNSTENGNHGKGGKGNIPGHPGTFYVYDYIRGDNWIGDHAYMQGMKRSNSLPECHPGKSGVDGLNTARIHNSTLKNIQPPSYIINDYKNYVRNNFKNNVRETFLKKFIDQLENHDSIKALYDTLAFVKELQALEEFFYTSNDISAFLPFYQSLLHRIKAYASKQSTDNTSDDNIKVLHYLNAATQSKISSLVNHNKKALVINLPGYIEYVIKEFKKLNDLKRIDVINNYETKYKDLIQTNIQEIKMFIETQIIPGNDKIMKDLDEKINDMLKENYHYQNETEEKINNLVDEQRKMQFKLLLRSILEIIKFASVFLSLLGPVGTAVGLAISAGATIIDNVGFGDENDSINFSAVLSEIEKPLSSAEEIFENKQTRFKTEIDDLEAIIKQNSGNELEDIQKMINDTKTVLTKVSNQKVDGEILDYMNNRRKELVESLDVKKKENDKNENTLMKIDIMKNILKVGQAGFDCYKNIKSEQEKVKKFANAIEFEKAKLNKFQQEEQLIYKSIIPVCKNIRNMAEAAEHNLKNKSHAALDISKWKIQNTLRDIKIGFRKMAQGYSVQEDFANLITKLDDNLTTMILLFDRIQDYQDKVELTSYIAKINSHAIEYIKDDVMRSAVIDLKLILQTNIALEMYSEIIKAFEQYVYPFANLYLTNIALPLEHKPENIDLALVNITISITDLESKLMDTQNKLSYEEKFKMIKIKFGNSSIHNEPFYVWKYDDHKNDILDFLQAKNIILNADIRKGLPYNAIKFNNVGIYFRLHNVSKQKKFDELMSKFDIILTHLGNSYYRCANKIHVISSKNITLRHSLGKIEVEKNEIHERINKSVPLLSPYTLWNLKLDTNHEFKTIASVISDLIEYEKEPMDIELEGDGQYIVRHKEVCNAEIDKYYTLSETLPIETVPEEQDLETFIKMLRKQRSVHKDLLTENTENNVLTSGASKSIKFFFLDNIIYLIESGWITLQYFNPVNKLQHWLDKFHNNIENQDSAVFSNNVPTAIELINMQTMQVEFSKLSHLLIDDGIPVKDTFLFDNSLLCNQNNLFLLDLLIRQKSGVKYAKENVIVNKSLDSQYAQNLAYMAYLSTDKST